MTKAPSKAMVTMEPRMIVGVLVPATGSVGLSSGVVWAMVLGVGVGVGLTPGVVAEVVGL